MDRAAKRELIDHLHGELKSTGVVVVAHNTGMVAAQSAEFRKRVKEAGGSVKVAKNKLVQLALKDTDAQGISDLMKGPTILAYSKDPIAAAKVAVKYAKENEKLVILGAGYDGRAWRDQGPGGPASAAASRRRDERPPQLRRKSRQGATGAGEAAVRHLVD